MYARQHRHGTGSETPQSLALERVLRAMPRLLLLTAPAGYGKTTTALTYAKAFDSYATIDFARSQTVRAVLLALLKTIGPESARDPYLRQVQLSLAADEIVPPDLAERVIDVWCAAGKPAAVIFENAERLSPEIMPLFNEILEHRSADRACIVCSRTPLALRTSAIASPAETMRLGASDLALSEDETRALFADTGISSEELRGVIGFAQGWPLATLLLRRLHAEGRLAAALSRAEHNSDFEHFQEFIQEQVIDSLPSSQRRVIEFCAIVPDVRVDDVQACLGSRGSEALRALTRTLPLIRVDNDRVDVHPLLRAPKGAEQQNDREDLRKAAAAALRRGDRDAAAERYIACGDRYEAVKVLDELLERGANAAVATLAASLDHDILERHPRWFALTTLLRRNDVSPLQSLASVQAQRARIEQNSDAIARLAVCTIETHLLLHCGLHEQAQERLRELDDLVLVLQRGGIVNAIRAYVGARFVDTLLAAFAVIAGEIGQGERLLKRARFAMGQFPMMTLSATADGWLLIGLIRDDIHMIRLQCSRARESLTRAGLDSVVVDLDSNEAFAGWVLGDDAMYEESLKRVDARARAYRVHAFDHLLGCAGVRAECEPTGLEPLRRLVIAHLFAAGRMKDGCGRAHAERALLFARELRHPVFVTLAAIAVRERGGDPHCEPGETLTISMHTQASFIARLRGQSAPRSQAIRLELLREPVQCDGKAVELSGRERDMLLLLTLAHRECGSAALAEQLGDADEPLTIAGVHTLIHRVRKRFSIDVLERSSRGYALHANVQADVRDIEDLLRSLPPQPDELWRRRLRAVLQTLCEALARGRDSGKMLPAFEQFVRTSGARLAAYLAEDAFARDDSAAVLDVANNLRDGDPCDETACELAIRAHLAQGDRESALQAYRAYAQTLSRELACEPSPHLLALLQSTEKSQSSRSPSTSPPQ